MSIMMISRQWHAPPSRNHKHTFLPYQVDRRQSIQVQYVLVVQLIDGTAGAQMSPFVSQESICLLLSPFVSIRSGDKWRQMETNGTLETNGDKSKKGSELEEHPLSPKSPKIFWRAQCKIARNILASAVPYYEPGMRLFAVCPCFWKR